MRNKVLGLIGAAALAAGTSILTPTAASAAATLDYYGPLAPVTVNHVTGSGGIWLSLTGNSAKFTLVVSGLLAGAPHPAQLWVGGQGRCPTAAQATAHNGHPTVGLADEAAVIGTVGASLTTSGDTSASSALDVSRYPTAGDYTYTRTFDIDPAAIAAVKSGTAVLVVHGIDYNGNGRYDDVLGATAGVPAEQTDPALCGTLVAAQMKQAVPTGSADTGGGSAAAAGSPAEIGLGVAALVGAAVAAVIAFRRHPGRQSAEGVVTNGFRRLRR